MGKIFCRRISFFVSPEPGFPNFVLQARPDASGGACAPARGLLPKKNTDVLFLS